MLFRSRAIRVGFHVGPVIEESSDVFGDTVNMAARMAGFAKGMQIITTLATVERLSPALTQTKLHLTHGASELVLEQANAAVLLGRDAGCQIVLADRKASRVHARIERRRDKFFLVDQSSNGTYVTFAGESEMVLRREELILRGRGQIAFGHSIVESSGEIVKFSVLD